MKNLIITLFFALFAVYSFAQSVTKITTIHSIKGNNITIYAPCANVTYKTVKGTRILIETTVSIDKPLNVLNYLIEKGRYSTKVVHYDNDVRITYNVLTPIAAAETIESVIVYVPESVKLVTIL